MCICNIFDLVTTLLDAIFLPVLFITSEPFSRGKHLQTQQRRVLSQAETWLSQRHQRTNVILLTTLMKTNIYSGSLNNKTNLKYQIHALKYQIHALETQKMISVPPTQHTREIPSLLPAAARRGCWRTCAGTWGQSCSSWKTQRSENTRSREACLNQIGREKKTVQRTRTGYTQKRHLPNYTPQTVLVCKPAPQPPNVG